MSVEPYCEEVDTFCCQTRRMVAVLLHTSQAKPPKFDVIAGAPESCNFEAGCSRGAGCLLKAIRISTRRRQR